MRPDKDASRREILFYYRDDCHLCEEMAKVLQYQWPALFAQIEWRDVDLNTEWQASFGLLIPALVVDEKLICNYMVEPEKINACFSKVQNPV